MPYILATIQLILTGLKRRLSSSKKILNFKFNSICCTEERDSLYLVSTPWPNARITHAPSVTIHAPSLSIKAHILRDVLRANLLEFEQIICIVYIVPLPFIRDNPKLRKGFLLGVGELIFTFI